MENLTFEDYLKQKKIDPELFRSGDPEMWKEFNENFDQVHPASFTARKLFMINAIRRKYPLKTAEIPAKPATAPAAKPKIIMKPKIR